MSDALALNVQYPADRTAVVTVAGDLDLHTAHILRERALAVVDQGVTHLILDLAQVEFFDSTGLITLVTLLDTTQQASGSLRLAETPNDLMQMVTVTSISQLLPVHATVADALAGRSADGPMVVPAKSPTCPADGRCPCRGRAIGQSARRGDCPMRTSLLSETPKTSWVRRTGPCARGTPRRAAQADLGLTHRRPRTHSGRLGPPSSHPHIISGRAATATD